MEEFVECIKESNIKVRPLLKWAGGKSKLLPLILPFLGQGDYLEPFLGSGAVAFAVQSNKMILNDKNIKLMNFYEQVKNRPEKLHRKIVKYASSFNCAPDKEVFFYETRAYYNDLTMVEYNNGLTHASLFWVINKTCFNGMYRETKGGDFNIPYGKRDCPIPDINDFLSVSRILKNCKLYHKPFDIICDMAKTGDTIYLDPPYIPISKTAGFSDYLRYGFGLDNHKKLCNLMQELSDRGVNVLMSNSSCDLVMDIYGGLKGFNFNKIQAHRFISGQAKGRGKVTELLISNRS